MLPNYLASIKSSGIYRFVFDRSEAPTPDAQVLRLVIGYSEKGPFNTPVYVEQPDEFIKIFGGRSKKLERYGMWFHRLCLQALEAGPIIAFNIKNFENANPGDNEVEYTTFNPTDSIFHTNPGTGLEDKLRMTIKDLYNTDRFWTLEPEHLEDYLQDKEDTDPTHLFKKGYITITSTDSKDTSTTIFMRGYEPTGYDVPFMEWYSSVLNGEELPSWLEGHERDLVSQYWAELFIFKGEFTPEIASSENLAKFFNVSGRTVTLKPYITNAFGEKVDTLDALAANDASNFLRKYSGILLPDFRNANNTVVSLDAQVNSENYIHKLMMRLNQDMLFNIDVNDPTSFQISDIDTTGWTKGPGYTGPMMSADSVEPVIFTATWSGTEWNYNEGSHAGEDPDYYQYVGLNPVPDPSDAYTWTFNDTDERFGATGIREGDVLYLGKIAHVVKIVEHVNTVQGDMSPYINAHRIADAKMFTSASATTPVATFNWGTGNIEIIDNGDPWSLEVVWHNNPDQVYYISKTDASDRLEMFDDAALSSSSNVWIEFNNTWPYYTAQGFSGIYGGPNGYNDAFNALQGDIPNHIDTYANESFSIYSSDHGTTSMATGNFEVVNNTGDVKEVKITNCTDASMVDDTYYEYDGQARVHMYGDAGLTSNTNIWLQEAVTAAETTYCVQGADGAWQAPLDGYVSSTAASSVLTSNRADYIDEHEHVSTDVFVSDAYADTTPTTETLDILSKTGNVAHVHVHGTSTEYYVDLSESPYVAPEYYEFMDPHTHTGIGFAFGSSYTTGYGIPNATVYDMGPVFFSSEGAAKAAITGYKNYTPHFSLNLANYEITVGGTTYNGFVLNGDGTGSIGDYWILTTSDATWAATYPALAGGAYILKTDMPDPLAASTPMTLDLYDVSGLVVPSANVTWTSGGYWYIDEDPTHYITTSKADCEAYAKSFVCNAIEGTLYDYTDPGNPVQVATNVPYKVGPDDGVDMNLEALFVVAPTPGTPCDPLMDVSQHRTRVYSDANLTNVVPGVYCQLNTVSQYWTVKFDDSTEYGTEADAEAFFLGHLNDYIAPHDINRSVDIYDSISPMSSSVGQCAVEILSTSDPIHIAVLNEGTASSVVSTGDNFYYDSTNINAPLFNDVLLTDFAYVYAQTTAASNTYGIDGGTARYNDFDAAYAEMYNDIPSNITYHRLDAARLYNNPDPTDPTGTCVGTTQLEYLNKTGNVVHFRDTQGGNVDYYVNQGLSQLATNRMELFFNASCTTSANLWADINAGMMWKCTHTPDDQPMRAIYTDAYQDAWNLYGYYVTTRTWDMTLDVVVTGADMTNFYKCVGSVSYTSRNVRPLYLEGYTYGNPKPASTKQWDKLQWQNYMLDALKVYKGLRIALTSRVDLEYRYLVDTFESYVQNECKSILATLAKEKDNCFALLNWPLMKNFTKCEYTSFRNEKNEFDTKYIPMGGNPLKPMSVYFSLPSQENGASWCAFFSAVKIQDLNTRVKEDVPSAALVSNDFMLKYSKYLPYTIMAGTNRGVLHEAGLLGPDFNFWRGDLDNLEPFGCNCMVYVDRKGTCINSNQTAKQNPVTALSKINVRELVIFLQDEIEKMMLDYHWDFNTPNLQARIKDRADVILETAKNNGGVYAYVNQCDDKTNTDDVINNEMLVLRTSIEPGMGAGKMVQELYIYRKGGLSSTISES